MSENQAWYQNGWIMLFLAVVVLPLGIQLFNEYQESQLPHIRPQVAVRMEDPFGEGPVLHVVVWHQNAGNLRNGVLVVSVKGELVEEEENRATRVHTFETWEPNKENQLEFEIPLIHFDPEVELRFTVLMKSVNCQQSLRMYDWKGNDMPE
ncbi:hypothetical protein [Rubinisphaera brasiliensis]|uniref:Uncharacterized protein n=1 Tax=Rubinisphaera brasiliensis (strain ATCC 49424 / DSM 5305 / JCM 21570 / IAM 15109 / NBRC 103401 / IFAM 1448) TaxID=756272 RepID=F0SR70_RUBBR|nr:hypothetical protein [Rubinisphaera brasiliensis]ADY61317.1 hypothetical protein Plabr_3727 [Rubinisphaera brasiliensis DSM 5305]